MPVALQNIFRFILLIFFQVLVLNNLQFMGFINPYVYVLFVLSLPYRMPRWLTLVLGFITGLVIDMFANTGGMHAFATVLVAFMRNKTIDLFIAIDEGNNPTPSFHSFGINAYLKYMILMVVVHHSSLFLLEAFSFSNFGLLFGKILLSSLVTILIIFGIQSLNKR